MHANLEMGTKIRPEYFLKMGALQVCVIYITARNKVTDNYTNTETDEFSITYVLHLVLRCNKCITYTNTTAYVCTYLCILSV